MRLPPVKHRQPRPHSTPSLRSPPKLFTGSDIRFYCTWTGAVHSEDRTMTSETHISEDEGHEVLSFRRHRLTDERPAAATDAEDHTRPPAGSLSCRSCSPVKLPGHWRLRRSGALSWRTAAQGLLSIQFNLSWACPNTASMLFLIVHVAAHLTQRREQQSAADM